MQIGDKVKIKNGDKYCSSGIPNELIIHGNAPKDENVGEIVAVHGLYYIVRYLSYRNNKSQGLRTMQLGFLEENLEILQQTENYSVFN